MLADADIDDAAMQVPDILHGRNLAGARREFDLAQNRLQDHVAQMLEIAAVQFGSGQAGGHEDAHPFILKNERAVFLVERQQPVSQRHRSVRQTVGPVG